MSTSPFPMSSGVSPNIESYSLACSRASSAASGAVVDRLRGGLASGISRGYVAIVRKQSYDSEMGTQGRAGDRLRQRLRDERARRGLSQRAIANLFAPNGL